MRARNRFVGIGSLDRARRLGIALAGVCLVAMAIGVTPGWSVGQMIGASMAVLAFGSVIALATAPRENTHNASIAGRIDDTDVSRRRAA